MLHMEDEATLAAIMGEGVSMTKAIQREYEARLKMMHRCGRVGPLGPDQIVSLLRHLNFDPLPVELPKEKFNPSRVEKGDSIKIDGEKVATYVSRLTGGLHAVKYEGDDFVHEVAGYQMSAPDEEVEEEPDWHDVKAGTPVVAILEDDGRVVEASFIRVDDKADKLVVMPNDGKKHFRAQYDNVAVVAN